MIVTMHFIWRRVKYTVAHQRYRQTERTDRQTDKQRSDSIGRTVARKSADLQIRHDVRDSPGFYDDTASSSVASDTCSKSFNNSDDYSLSLSFPALASSRNNFSSTFASCHSLIIFVSYDVHPVPSFYSCFAVKFLSK